MSLTSPLKVNCELAMNPRAYGVQFEIYAATSGFAFLQNQRDGAQPLDIFHSLDQSVEFCGDVDTPNHYNKTEISSMMATIINLNNYYKKSRYTNIQY